MSTIDIEQVYKAWQAIGADIAGLKWEDFAKHLPEQPTQVAEPHKRTWVGLTYEETKEIYTCIHGYDSSKRIAEAIEAKLKAKNSP